MIFINLLLYAHSQMTKKRRSIYIYSLRRMRFMFPTITCIFMTLISLFDCFIGLASINPGLD